MSDKFTTMTENLRLLAAQNARAKTFAEASAARKLHEAQFAELSGAMIAAITDMARQIKGMPPELRQSLAEFGNGIIDEHGLLSAWEQTWREYVEKDRI